MRDVQDAHGWLWDRDSTGLDGLAEGLAGSLPVGGRRCFACLDLGAGAAEEGGAVSAAGLKVGSADLLAWRELISPDAGKRREAVERNAAHFEQCARHGIRNYFAVMLPEDASKSRSENFGLMVDSLNGLAPHLERHGGRLVIEGWPGPGALCCTPESYRATFRECSPSIGINYDPSHLLRMGIDPVRFLREFAARVFHVHGKDTELYPEAIYEYGTEIGATLAKPHDFGSMHWRYTIPGHGVTPWVEVLRVLQSTGYDGFVSIELEDENFNGSEQGEKDGFVLGAQFLAGC